MRNRLTFLFLLVVQLTSCEWNGNFEKGDNIYHLDDQSIFLCPIPGTIVQ